MKIWLAEYQLKPVSGSEPRAGYLLKVSGDDFAAGYADIFPWPQFGDPNFLEIPKLLQTDQMPALLQRSLFFAKKDGLAREEKKSLVAEEVLRNHFLVTDILNFSADTLLSKQGEGFREFKVKLTGDKNEISHLLKLSEKLGSQGRWRLDFNGRASVENLVALREIKSAIQFIEDPFSEKNDWSQFNDLPLAYDQPPFALDGLNLDWQIIKPAKQSLSMAHANNVVVTSYMDHPVGIAHAFVEAQSLGEQKWSYGLQSHKVYQETDFHRHLCSNGPDLSLKPGLGIGFDDLLARQKWVELK